MFNKINITKISTILLALAVSIQAGPVYAERGGHHEERHYYRYNDRPHFGLHVSFIPDACFTLSLGRQRYYYYDGLYYNQMGGEYMIVNPPVGAVVKVIPSDYRAIVINGVTYYTDNGIYYVYTRNGYQVVPQPVTVVQTITPVPVVVTQNPPAVVTAQAVTTQSTTAVPVQITVNQATPNSDELFTVNVPNDKGGYTAITLKRVGNGFVGPQNEYYSEFPRVSQLKAMYGK